MTPDSFSFAEDTAITCDTSGRNVALTTKPYSTTGSFGIYLSQDGGGSWTKAITNSSLVFTTIITDPSTGTHLLAGTAAHSIYYSDDAGVTWIKSNAPARQWNDLAVSSDGKVAIAVAERLLFDGAYWSPIVYLSKDFGHSWIASAAPSDNFAVSGVAAVVDSSGQHQAFVLGAGGMGSAYIYTSADSGDTWTANETPEGWIWADIASDYTGKYLVASSLNGALVRSSDYGSTWTSFAQSCPEFTVPVDFPTCSNPCMYPYIPSAYHSMVTMIVGSSRCKRLDMRLPLWCLASCSFMHW